MHSIMPNKGVICMTITARKRKRERSYNGAKYTIEIKQELKFLNFSRLTVDLEAFSTVDWWVEA